MSAEAGQVNADPLPIGDYAQPIDCLQERGRPSASLQHFPHSLLIAHCSLLIARHFGMALMARKMQKKRIRPTVPATMTRVSRRERTA